MTPLPMAPWVFLFGLTISCVLVWGAGAEMPQAALHYKWRSEQGLPHDKWRSEQGMVPAKVLRKAVEQFVCMNTQSQEDQEEQLPESWTPMEGWEDVDGSPTSTGKAMQLLESWSPVERWKDVDDSPTSTGRRKQRSLRPCGPGSSCSGSPDAGLVPGGKAC